MGILNYYLEKLNEVKNDISSVNINAPRPKIVEIGCGDGMATICLAQHFPGCDAIGIDKNPNDIQLAKTFQIKIQTNIHIASSLTFFIGDVITGINIPIGCDLIYCKKLLFPILENEFNNVVFGEKGVKQAINTFYSNLSVGGWLVLVEKCPGRYGRVDQIYPILEKRSCLEKVSLDFFEQNDLSTKGERSIFKTPYIRYVYRKCNDL